MTSTSGHGINGREIAERLARCVATMVFYQSDGWSWSGAQLMFEETRELVAWAKSLGDDRALDEYFIEPLRVELASRYDPKVSAKLHREFVRCLDAARAEDGKG